MELNLAASFEAIAREVPERDCLVWRDRRLSWADVDDRSRRLAAVLRGAGLGIADAGRAGPVPTDGWRSHQDHVALYLLNGTEYLEAMLGAYKARAVPFNVNYRYVADELAYVLADAGTRAIVYGGRFASTLAAVRDRLDRLELLLQVDDGSGAPLLDGAVDYEEALAAADPALPADLVASWSGDDQYMVYTGGTTGAPKGVLWRQADFLVAALGVRRRDGSDYEHIDEIVERARGGGLRALPAPPFMHGAAHWNAISAWVAGGTVVIQSDVEHLDPADVLATCERERVTSLLIVGDAFALPLIEELRRHRYDLSSLRHLMTGGAVLGAERKAALTELVPGLTVVDVLGSSETGRHGVASTGGGREPSEGSGFRPSTTTVVLSADLDRTLAPGDPEVGWLAQRGRVPRGYLNDPDKTRATFPTLGGVRHAVAGDRARLRADGTIELLGRDSVTINSGGEKIFAEEVEQALKAHPDVVDVVVVGRPSERWGSEVVAVVQLRPGSDADADTLREAAGRTIARYKLPKAVVVVDRVERNPNGKANYRWASERARGSSASA
ncbi:MAG: AMP-binding protein [Actinomycetota bacterium]|nr:AMP-binding protein [Actinomycetota bacterium]